MLKIGPQTKTPLVGLTQSSTCRTRKTKPRIVGMEVEPEEPVFAQTYFQIIKISAESATGQQDWTVSCFQWRPVSSLG